MDCPSCGSSDTEVYPAESPGEPTILHCHECGHDQRITPKTDERPK